MQAAANRPGADELEHVHRVGQPLDLSRAEGLEVNEALHQPERLGREQDGSRRGQLLHAGRQVGGLAYRGVVHVQVAADGTHHHLARVEADADLDLRAVGATPLIDEPANGGLHGQRRIARAQAVVLVRERRPE